MSFGTCLYVVKIKKGVVMRKEFESAYDGDTRESLIADFKDEISTDIRYYEEHLISRADLISIAITYLMTLKEGL